MLLPMLLAPCMLTPALLCKRAVLLSPFPSAAMAGARCIAMPVQLLRIIAPDADPTKAAQASRLR